MVISWWFNGDLWWFNVHLMGINGIYWEQTIEQQISICQQEKTWEEVFFSCTIGHGEFCQEMGRYNKTHRVFHQAVNMGVSRWYESHS
jgi:hypothetical protein